MDYDNWIEWLDANPDASEADKLTALRKYIYELAETWVASGEITAGWADKKLPQLGVAARIGHEQAYTLTAPVNAMMDLQVRATSRLEALNKAKDLLLMNGGGMVKQITPGATGPVFVDGPEDPDPAVLDDAPTTVDGTLVKLREVIMLGNIAGPRWDCTSGTNRVLASFGLAPLPERKTFTVGVPVEGVMKTTVQAYDEESALRVAGWRWDSDRAGYDLGHATATSTATAVPIA